MLIHIKQLLINEMLAVICNNIKIIQATGTATSVRNPVPKIFKVFFPTNWFVLFKNFGVSHKQTNQIITTNTINVPKSRI